MSEQTTAAGDTLPEPSPSSLPRRPKPLRTGAGLLLLGGFAAAAGGFALHFAPLYSWRAVKVGREIAALGVENGHLVLGGTVVFALGLFARALGRLAARQSQELGSVSNDVVVEQLAIDLADLRSALRELAHRSAAVAEEQKVLLRNQHALLESLETQVPEGGDSSQSQNALFRLAASMDQMSARMETRIKHLDEELHKLETANPLPQAGAPYTPPPAPQTPPAAQHGSTGAMLGVNEPAQPLPAAQPLQPAPAPEPELRVTVELEEDPDLPMQPSDEFFDTVQQLESAVEAAMNKRAQDEKAATIDLAQAAPEALDALLPDDE